MATTKKTVKKVTETQFLEMFNAVKSEEKGRKSATKALIGTTERNFKKMVSKGYSLEDLQKATVAMFRDKEQWAVNTGNDIPEHLLRPDNFARYLNLAENPEVKKQKQAQQVQKIEVKIAAPEYSAEEMEASKRVYSKSLRAGDWLGKITDAAKIGTLFRNEFTKEEIKHFFDEGNRIAAENKSKSIRTGSTTSLEVAFERMAKTYGSFVMYELAIKEAIKRKIKAPWQ
tara:strand:- start:808 stop:1494 length:687 start_codon:yes stop_codon:yes gene_type:complete